MAKKSDPASKKRPELDLNELQKKLEEKSSQVAASLQQLIQAKIAEQSGPVSSDRPEVLIVIATEGEEAHLLDVRLHNLPRTPSPYGRHKKHSVDNIKLRCGNHDVNALLVILTGKGEARACAVVQCLLSQLSEAGQMPKLIINLGISATMSKDVRLGDVVVAESLSRYLEDAKVKDIRNTEGKTVDYEIELRAKHEPRIDSDYTNHIHIKCKSDSKAVTGWRKLSEDTIKSCDLVAPPNPEDTRSNENEVQKAKRLRNEAETAKDVAQANVDHCGDGRQQKTAASKALERAVQAVESAERELIKTRAGYNPSAYRELADSGVVHLNADLVPHFGIIMSGPLLVDSKIFKAEIASEDDNYLALDMESGGIGWAWQETHVVKKPRLLIIRGISDYGNGSKKATDTAVAIEGDTGEEDKRRIMALKKITPGTIRKLAMLRCWDLMICILAERLQDEIIPARA